MENNEFMSRIIRIPVFAYYELNYCNQCAHRTLFLSVADVVLYI